MGINHLSFSKNFAPRPGIELPCPKEEREKKKCEERQGFAGGFENPTQRPAPSPGRQIVNHEEGETSHGNPEPDQFGTEIRDIELARIPDPTENAQGQADESNPS